jgi:DNA-binding NarL/FixJ family response regulator
MTVVLADDSVLLRSRIKELLSRYKNISIVGEAENGLAAFNMILEIKPDLVILDIRMPELNGIEVLNKIREAGLNTIVCMLTNYPYRQYKERCLADGANYFFDKNLAIDELKKVLASLADDHENKI